MELKFLVLLIGIGIFILYHFFEAWGNYEFEPFAYKIGIIVKKITLKIKAKSFSGFENKFYRMDNINYKFISNDTCLVRLGSKEVSPRMYIRPIPTFSYKINIKHDKYVISLKISFLYLIIIGFLLYALILNHKGLKFNDFLGLIVYFLLFVFLIIFSRNKMKKVAINFIKILRKSV
jgi:hypothetical protein